MRQSRWSKEIRIFCLSVFTAPMLPATQQQGDRGIGLAIARAICENHGGSIQAESKDGHSLTITVVL